jgi:hypothetical protein
MPNGDIAQAIRKAKQQVGEVMIRTDVKKVQEGIGNIAGIEPIETDCGRQHDRTLGEFKKSHTAQRLAPRAMLFASRNKLKSV